MLCCGNLLSERMMFCTASCMRVGGGGGGERGADSLTVWYIDSGLGLLGTLLGPCEPASRLTAIHHLSLVKVALAY